MHKNSPSPLLAIWMCNIILYFIYTIGGSSLTFLKSSVLEYSTVISDPFDGAISPIAYVPDWSKGENMNKSRLFESFNISDFISIPEYNNELLSDTLQKTTNDIILRYTYPVVYMGSYRGNYTEYDGSHAAVDIRAPIGTPVMAIANGVVIKVKNTETGDGKYVTIRHDNIEINGTKETLYSGYLHLSEITAIEGTKIKRGEILGKVGMTGITTTPHLHYQIDKEVAPFHMYWPYTFKEAADLGLDFFGAINVGLGKENAIRYTIHPMDFIKNHRFLGSAPREIQTTQEIKTDPIVLSSEIVADVSIPDNEKANIPSIPNPVISPEIEKTLIVIPKEVDEAQKNISPIFIPDNVRIFSDIGTGSTFYNATKYLKEIGVVNGYEDGGFHPNNKITRSEAIILYDRLFKKDNNYSYSSFPFLDILPSDEVSKVLVRALANKTVSSNLYFRPNDFLTRAEGITFLIRASGIALESNTYSFFRDVKIDSSHTIYINTFAKYLSIREGNFEPNKDITRGELAKILYMFKEKES